MNVADIMSSPVYVINIDEPVSHARNLMLRHRISTLLVLNEGKMVESSRKRHHQPSGSGRTSLEETAK